MGAYGEHRKRLARELKARIVAAGGQDVHVRGGQGTGWGWIDVSGSLRGGEFTPGQKQAVQEVTGSPTGVNFWVGQIEDVERILGIPFDWQSLN